MSAIIGSLSPRGMAKAIGLVPKKGLAPGAGATAEGELAKPIPIRPAAAMRCTNQPTTPAE